LLRTGANGEGEKTTTPVCRDRAGKADRRSDPEISTSYFVACSYDNAAKAGPETARHPHSATAASVSPLNFIL
jgi:hypothetical protein